MSTSPIVNAVQSLLGGSSEPLVVGLESASSILGLSQNWVFPLTILSKNELTLDNSTMNVPYELVVAPDMADSAAILRAGIPVTGTAQTIIDMIRYDRDPQTITEAISSVMFSTVNEDVDLNSLRDLADVHGVLDELESYVPDAAGHVVG